MTFSNSKLKDLLPLFVIESWGIEGLDADDLDLGAHTRFLNTVPVTVESLERFVMIVEPEHRLRVLPSMNVRVGKHIAPPGGGGLVTALTALLTDAHKYSVFEIYTMFEHLHPFTDCNGRVGRALWLWYMVNRKLPADLGFLRTFHYQALANADTRISIDQILP